MTSSPQSIEALLAAVSLAVRVPLETALNGGDVSAEAARPLLDAHGVELAALGMVADELRRRQVGELVTFVVNRNINFTNVCVKRCGFCAFSRDHRTDEGYQLPIEVVVERALEAQALGATEVCLQAGLAPGMAGLYYVELCRAVKRAAPALHVHAFSPEEVCYGASRARLSVAEYLIALREAGIGSLPGTSAEILDDDLRDRISPGRITTAGWLEVITTAHRLGIPTTATMMYGHLESSEQVLAHLALLRQVQRDTGGFTEFVPLSFVHREAPMWSIGPLSGLRPGPTGTEIIRVHATARVMLGAVIKNLQCSWVKDGLKLAQVLLTVGANDLGGTLINESISTAAGAEHGQLQPPRELRRAIRGVHRTPAERSTCYQIRRLFADPATDDVEPLDALGERDRARFGSFHEQIKLGTHRFARTDRNRQV